MRVVLLGPPGAGKGTQSEIISKQLGVPKISVGDILKQQVGQGTSLGREAKPYLDNGKLVPDDVIIGMVRDRLAGPDTGNGFVLDGFPRTVPQAMALDAGLASAGTPLDLVIELVVGREDIITRLAGRRVCPHCERIWHVEFDPPSVPGICDRCGHTLIQRSDDNPETIAQRLDEYAAKTEPLTGFYASQGKLVRIDATGPAETVAAATMTAIKRSLRA